MTKEVEAALLSATIASRRSHCLGFERAARGDRSADALHRNALQPRSSSVRCRSTANRCWRIERRSKPRRASAYIATISIHSTPSPVRNSPSRPNGGPLRPVAASACARERVRLAQIVADRRRRWPLVTLSCGSRLRRNSTGRRMRSPFEGAVSSLQCPTVLPIARSNLPSARSVHYRATTT